MNCLMSSSSVRPSAAGLAVAQLVGQHHARAQVVAEGEAAGEVQGIKIVDAHLPVQHLVEVHDGGLGAGHTVGGGEFFFAVDAKARQNQGPHRASRSRPVGLCLRLNFMCCLRGFLYHFKSLLGQWN